MAGLSVLLVDDDVFVSRMIKHMLLEVGISQVYTAKNGKEALHFIDSNADDVDFVLCDWNMPCVSGIEVLQQVKMVKPDLPFVMVTARNDMKSVMTAKNSGVNGYLCKGFSANELKARITKCVLN